MFGLKIFLSEGLGIRGIVFRGRIGNMIIKSRNNEKSWPYKTNGAIEVKQSNRRETEHREEIYT